MKFLNTLITSFLSGTVLFGIIAVITFLCRNIITGKINDYFNTKQVKLKDDLSKEREISNRALDESFQTKIETLKHDLGKQTEEFKQELANHGHNTQFMFEFKVKIYSEFSEKTVNAVLNFNSLFPIIDEVPRDHDEEIKEYRSRYKKSADSYNDCLKFKKKYFPFFNQEVISISDEIFKYMDELMRYFKYMHFDPAMKSYAQKHRLDINDINEKLNESSDNFLNKIREIFENI